MSCGCSQPVSIREAISAARKSLVALTVDGVDSETVDANAAVCRACEDRQRKYGADWCGEPLKKTDKTCGCIVHLKIRTPGEKCPQRKW